MIDPLQTAAVGRRLSPTASAHLDLARGLAAGAVLLQHIRSGLLLDWQLTTEHSAVAAALYFFAKFGHAAVVVFFVLSGFLVGSSGIRAVENGTWSLRRYMLHRLLRLEIVLVPALLIGWTCDEIGIHRFHAYGLYSGNWHLLLRWTPIDLAWPTLLGNAAFLQGFKVPTFGSNAALWSLANEFWYYILFGLLLTLLLRGRKLWLRLLLAALAALVVWFVGYTIISLSPLWFMGLGVYFLPPLRLSQGARIAFQAIALLAFLFVQCASQLVHHGIYTQSPVFDFVTGILFSLLLYAFLHTASSPGGYRQFAHRLAAPSYTLYANHMPAVFLLVAWIGVQQQPTPLHCLEVAGCFIAYWVCAYGLYLLFESRTQAVRRWLEPKLFPSL